MRVPTHLHRRCAQPTRYRVLPNNRPAWYSMYLQSLRVELKMSEMVRTVVEWSMVHKFGGYAGNPDSAAAELDHRDQGLF